MSFYRSWFVCMLVFVSEAGHQELCAQDLLWHNTATGQLATWAAAKRPAAAANLNDPR